MNVSVGLLHGDMSQVERNEVISSFKKKEMPILVATDVAGECLYHMQTYFDAIALEAWYLAY